MKLLTRAQLRFFRLAPWSTGAVLVGVVLAVASIVAVHQLSVRVSSSLDAATPAYLETVSYLLRRPDLAMTDYFELRAAWRRGELPQLEGLMPLVEGQALVRNRVLTVVGLDAFSGMPAVAGLAFVAPGQAILRDHGGGIAQGDLLRIGDAEVEVAALSDAVPESMLVTDIGTAQRLLGGTDELLSRIAVRVASPVRVVADWADRLLPGIAAGFDLPAWTLPGWQVDDLDAELPSLAFARSVLFNLGALASLALVVAWLLTFQACVVWLRRRQLTLDRLRLMGVSDRELLAGFLKSLLLIGVAACGLGVLAGQALAWLLAGLGGAAYLSEGSGAAGWQAVDGWLAGKALGSAVGVCVVGGALAFWKERGGGRRGRAAAAALAVALVGVWGGAMSDALIGAFAAIAAAGVLALLAIGPLLRALRTQGHRLKGGSLLGRLGVRELLFYPQDLAVAIGALALAIATSVAIALMVESFRADFSDMLDLRLGRDVFVRGDGRDLTALAERLEAHPAVVGVGRYGSTPWRLAGRSVELSYTGFNAVEAARYGLDRALAPDECLVSERLARALGLAAGDMLTAIQPPPGIAER